MGLTSSKDGWKDIQTKWYDSYVSTELPPSCFSGKTVAITGSTSGTGYVLAETCVKQGAENVLLLNRPSDRATAAAATLKELAANVASESSTKALDNDNTSLTATKNATKVDAIDCDLQDFDSVIAAAEVIKSKYEAIDVLCNNAGVMALEDAPTKLGYDVQMQTNHLSHFLLTKELFPLLVRASELRGESRIVHHSSMARSGTPLKPEYFGKNGGNLGGNSSFFFSGARWERYHQTKLANAVMTVELSDRLKQSTNAKGVKAVVAAPGLAATNLQVTSNNDGGMGLATIALVKAMRQSAQDGTMPLLAACFHPKTENGDFWEPSTRGMYGIPVKVPHDKNSMDVAQRTMLWTKSEEACGEFKID